MNSSSIKEKTIGDLEVLGEDSGWLVCRQAGGRMLRLRALDLQVLPSPKALERGLRRASWLLHPGWCSLRELLVDEDRLYVCGPMPERLGVADYLAEHPQPLESLVGWLYQLVEMLMEIHNQRAPLYLGQLTSADLRVSPRGSLQVLGLDLAESLNLRFRPASRLEAPDAVLDGRTDIWCLGQLFQEWLSWSGMEVRRRYDENRRLAELIGSMCSKHAERRPSNLNLLKSRLDQLKFAAPVASRGLRSQLPAAWELARDDYQKLLIGALCTFVTGILVTGWLFPA